MRVASDRADAPSGADPVNADRRQTRTTVGDDLVAYERWLRRQCEVDEEALELKHHKMRASAFDFLRAGYFRWCRVIEVVCVDLCDAPRVLCVGDIHVENFGTWRDAESRWVWGINDLDEAASMPYAFDLVRLAASAALAPGIGLDVDDIGEALLDGYRRELDSPQPVLLDDRLSWLRQSLLGAQDRTKEFWSKLDGATPTRPPKPLVYAIRRTMPFGTKIMRVVSIVRGAGSLGRPRLVAIGEWRGGRVLREAKAIVPSAWHWAHREHKGKSSIMKLAEGRHRTPEADFLVVPGWQIRRIAPDTRKLDLADVGREGLSARLLAAMGAQLAAAHAGHRRRQKIADDLAVRPGNWLASGAAAALEQVQEDFARYGQE